MLKLLRNRNYLFLWAGQTISLIGDNISSWALVFWVFRASGQSPIMQAIGMIAGVGPTVIVGPFAGVLVDRWDRRRTMVIADLIRGVLSVCMVLAVSKGQIWAAVGLVFLLSCVAQFFDPARSALTPRIVPTEQLVVASSLGQTTRTVLSLAGPALGTAVYLVLGARISFTLDAASFFISALFITLVNVSGAVTTETGMPHSFLREFTAGIRFAWEARPIRAIIIGLAILFLGGGALNTLSLFILKHLGLDPANLGWVATLQSVFMLVGSLAVGSSKWAQKRAPLLVPAGLFLGAVGMGFAAAATNLWWYAAGTVFFGLCNALLNIGVGVCLQTLVPDEMRGRVVGSAFSLPMAAMLLSAAAAGVLAGTYSAQSIVGWANLFFIAGTVYLYITLRHVTIGANAAEGESA